MKKSILRIIIGVGLICSLTACGVKEEKKETDSINVEHTSKEDSSTTDSDSVGTTEEVESDNGTLETTTLEQTVTEEEKTTTEAVTTKKQETTTKKENSTTKKQETTTKKEDATTKKEESSTNQDDKDKENKKKYVEAAKKCADQYFGNAAAFDDVNGDGIPEFFYVQSDGYKSFDGYFFVYENGEYKNNFSISWYEGMRLYKEKTGGKYVGLEIADHYTGCTFILVDFENKKEQELAYIDKEDGVYIYQNEKFDSVEQVKKKMFAEFEKNYTYVRDMAKSSIWASQGDDTFFEKAYDNYLKVK